MQVVGWKSHGSLELGFPQVWILIRVMVKGSVRVRVRMRVWFCFRVRVRVRVGYRVRFNPLFRIL